MLAKKSELEPCFPLYKWNKSKEKNISYLNSMLDTCSGLFNIHRVNFYTLIY